MSRASIDEIEELLRQQRVLARFSQFALRSNQLSETLAEACILAREALDTDCASVFTFGPEGTAVTRAPCSCPREETAAGIARAHEPCLPCAEPRRAGADPKAGRTATEPLLVEQAGNHAALSAWIVGAASEPPFGLLQVDCLTSRVFSESDGVFLQTYANLIGVTVHRLRALQTARADEAQLRSALERTGWGLMLVDLTTNEVQRTSHFDAIFGPGCEPGHADWSDAILQQIVPEDRDRIAQALDAAARTATGWLARCRVWRASDGALRSIEFTGHYHVGQDGMPTRLMSLAFDRTEGDAIESGLRQANETLEGHLAKVAARLQAEADERARVEEVLRHAHKMEALGQMTGGLAHDFNNLLGVIKGNLELAHMRAMQGRSEDVTRYIEPAMTSATRASALTHRLLAFARRQVVEPKPIDANRSICEMEDLIRRTAGPSVTVELRLTDEPWPVRCDVNQLENALLNLVINARDAMPLGGELTVGTENIGLAAEEGRSDGSGADHLAISVTDTGAGMTPDVADRVFDPFFTTKPVGKGTGLGLSMTNGFVKQAGGSIRLSSEPGKGTKVTIFLPRCHDTVDDPVEARESSEPQRAATGAVVLLVDDEPGMRLVILDVLQDLGCTVIEASDAPSALAVIASDEPLDLLLADVGLPGRMNGRQLAESARRQRPGLKVLFITGYEGEAAREPEVLSPVLIKPFGVEMLAAKVHELIGV